MGIGLSPPGGPSLNLLKLVIWIILGDFWVYQTLGDMLNSIVSNSHFGKRRAARVMTILSLNHLGICWPNVQLFNHGFATIFQSTQCVAPSPQTNTSISHNLIRCINYVKLSIGYLALSSRHSAKAFNYLGLLPFYIFHYRALSVHWSQCLPTM